jgi:hypothetical protein
LSNGVVVVVGAAVVGGDVLAGVVGAAGVVGEAALVVPLADLADFVLDAHPATSGISVTAARAKIHRVLTLSIFHHLLRSQGD